MILPYASSIMCIRGLLCTSLLMQALLFGAIPYGYSSDFTSYENNGISETYEHSGIRIEQVFSGLEYPIGLAFLGVDDMLVIEKDKGTVQRIVKYQMSEVPLLDNNVANDREKYGNQEERGMLGIAVSRIIPNKTFVFLYFTEAKEKDGGEPIGNRLYRYELVNNKLVNPRMLLDLPAEPGPSHNGGVLAIGLDDNIYAVVGNLLGPGLTEESESTLDQNVEEGNEPVGTGGILRVTQDGKAVNETGILGDSHPLDKYYAYGIRNSFGLAFDPVTDNLWDTENGGAYDEINLVIPGFNSGWNKVMGKSSLQDDFDPTADLVDFSGNGKYSDPELSFKVVPTAIVFLSSDKFGKEFKDDMFVATAIGNIYHFDLNEDRTELVLRQSLKDGIAESQEDLQDILFATELGIITDLEVGPDGFLYGVSYEENGSIFRIVPN
jgi:aldose sugar dehydrogenase